MGYQCSPDAAVHELWQDPKMVELPRVIRRHQGVEAYNLVPDPCHERRPRSNRVARDAEVLPPRFDRGGRIAPIRFRLERKGGKSFCFVLLRWADVHLAILRFGLFIHEDYCDSGRSRATSARYSDTLLAARGLAMTRSVFSRSHFYSLTLSNIPIAGLSPKRSARTLSSTTPRRNQRAPFQTAHRLRHRSSFLPAGQDRSFALSSNRGNAYRRIRWSPFSNVPLKSLLDGVQDRSVGQPCRNRPLVIAQKKTARIFILLGNPEGKLRPWFGTCGDQLIVRNPVKAHIAPHCAAARF